MLPRYERMHEPLASRGRFLRRLWNHVSVALAIIGVSLLLGMAGYHGFEGLSWLDAYANAAMILSGMGPLAPLHSTAGKLFAGAYALYSGLLLIAVAGVVLAPVLHRVLHVLRVGDEPA